MFAKTWGGARRGRKGRFENAGKPRASHREAVTGQGAKGKKRHVSAFNVPEDLLLDTAVFLLGSPAGHDPKGQVLDDNTSHSFIRFKEDVFYSLCWNSPEDSVVAMTYSASACGSLSFWTLPQSSRVLLVAPAWFELYKPRRGLANSLESLSNVEDTMLAMYFSPSERNLLVIEGAPATESTQRSLKVQICLVRRLSIQWYLPPKQAAAIRWHGDKVDGRASVHAWLRQGRLVSFGCYTAELELDVLRNQGGIPRKEDLNTLIMNLNYCETKDILASELLNF